MTRSSFYSIAAVATALLLVARSPETTRRPHTPPQPAPDTTGFEAPTHPNPDSLPRIAVE